MTDSSFSAKWLALFGAACIAACGPSTEVTEGSSAIPAAAAPAAAPVAGTAADASMVEWPFYGANLGSQRYSALDQIDASNASQL